MKPEEKAKELYLKYYIPDYCFAKAGMSSDWRQTASKKYATMVVDEIIDNGIKWMPEVDWWIEVKKQIQLI
jgi:hypothetical protein